MPATHWESGRLDSHRGAKRVLFGRVYEDSAIEQGAFPRGGRIACIASAGDLAIDLSAGHQVTAVDINPAQLVYAQRRAEGAPRQAGTAECVMAWGRRALRLAGWDPGLLETFLAMDDPARQAVFWRERLETKRFRLVVDSLLRPAVLHGFYAAALLAVLPARFGPVLRARMRRCWASHVNRSNPYARALLAGESNTATPPAATPIRFVCADLAEYLESCPPASFDGFAFSNILDGAEPGYRARLYRAARRAGTPRSVIVHRSFAEPAPDLALNLAGDDRSFLWGVVAVVPVN